MELQEHWSILNGIIIIIPLILLINGVLLFIELFLTLESKVTD